MTVTALDRKQSFNPEPEATPLGRSAVASGSGSNECVQTGDLKPVADKDFGSPDFWHFGPDNLSIRFDVFPNRLSDKKLSRFSIMRNREKRLRIVPRHFDPNRS